MFPARQYIPRIKFQKRLYFFINLVYNNLREFAKSSLKTKLRRALFGLTVPMKKNNNANLIATAGITAALYVVLTLVSAVFGLASGVIQVRISEALCVLPLFTTAAIPGLAVGCFIANLVSGGVVLDAVFGALTTLAAAAVTCLVGKTVKNKVARYALAPLANVVANSLTIPWVLKLVYGESGALWYFAVTVCVGEIISSYLLGVPLTILLEKHKKHIFK